MAEVTAPEGTAFVPMLLSRGGEPTAHALIDLTDAPYLERLGISSPWFFSRTTGRVLGRNAEGKEVPIARLLARPPRHLEVGFKDGDPFNLTRSNLVVVGDREGVVHVPVHRQGRLHTYAAVDQEDFSSLQDQGVLFPWFLSDAQPTRIRAKLSNGKVVPVDLLLMKPGRTERVVYQDGDHTNLTRTNLTLGPRPVIDMLIERDRKRHSKL